MDLTTELAAVAPFARYNVKILSCWEK